MRLLGERSLQYGPRSCVEHVPGAGGALALRADGEDALGGGGRAHGVGALQPVVPRGDHQLGRGRLMDAVRERVYVRMWWNWGLLCAYRHIGPAVGEPVGVVGHVVVDVAEPGRVALAEPAAVGRERGMMMA